jgi:hypothetical protein
MKNAMETPEQIERRLQRCLTPRGFSDAGMVAIDEMIDELAGEAGERSFFNGHSWWWMSGSVAAGVALAFGLTWLSQPDAPAKSATLSMGYQTVSLVSEEEGVVAAEADEQLFSDEDGNLMRAWHVVVVNREHFHDAETGHEVTVVHPRDEMVLMPVSSF